VIDQTTQQLFEPYYRTVGKHRYTISSFRQFEEYVLKTSGRDDVYVSVYPLDSTIDRLVFDFDKGNAFAEARRVYAWCLAQGFPTIPIISGSKGFHLHVLFKPIKVENTRELLMDKATYILNKSLGLKRYDESSVDFHVVGNPQAMIRVPNTLRAPSNISYCSYLPENWHMLSEEEVWHYSKYPHTILYHMKPTRTLLEFDTSDAPDTLNAQPQPRVSDYNPAEHLGDYRYIQKLLLHPVSDGRHRISRFILCPYFVNVVGYSDDEAYFMISVYLDRCSKLKPTTAKSTLMYDIKYARQRGFYPSSLKNIEKRDKDLFNIVSSVLD
jgi:hypothetical protein